MRKPLKAAAICGILVLTLTIFITFLNFTSTLVQSKAIIIFSSIISLAMSILSISFLYGFIVLARHFNARLLKVMAWIGIIFTLIIIVISFVGTIIYSAGTVSAQNDFENSGYEKLLSQGDYQKLQSVILPIIIGAVILFLILGLYTILFGVGLLKLKEVELAKTIGILEIIAGGLTVTIIGVIFAGFLAIVIMILEIIMFFKASEKFEK